MRHTETVFLHGSDLDTVRRQEPIKLLPIVFRIVFVAALLLSSVIITAWFPWVRAIVFGIPCVLVLIAAWNRRSEDTDKKARRGRALRSIFMVAFGVGLVLPRLLAFYVIPVDAICTVVLLVVWCRTQWWRVTNYRRHVKEGWATALWVEPNGSTSQLRSQRHAMSQRPTTPLGPRNRPWILLRQGGRDDQTVIVLPGGDGGELTCFEIGHAFVKEARQYSGDDLETTLLLEVSDRKGRMIRICVEELIMLLQRVWDVEPRFLMELKTIEELFAAASACIVPDEKAGQTRRPVRLAASDGRAVSS